jgi:hypothetical protein
MKQRPSETGSRSTGQEIPCLLLNQKVHCRVHKSSSQVPILSQMNPINTIQHYFHDIHLNIILPSSPRSSKLYFPFRLSN